MDIKRANQLISEGTISELFKSGFIDCKFFEYHEITLWVDAQIRSRNISKNRAVLEAEVRFNRSRKTIFKAIKSFEGILS